MPSGRSSASTRVLTRLCYEQTSAGKHVRHGETFDLSLRLTHIGSHAMGRPSHCFRSSSVVVSPQVLACAFLLLSAPAKAQESEPAPARSEEKRIEMESYQVSTDIVEGSALGLNLLRKSSSAISDAISSDDFSRLAVGNAAEAMTKVTGASLVEGKYVMIRGLGDRYANTLLNGASLPTADPEKRAVQLDQFPSGLIESIVTTKSFTPDQPGAFSGGSVNLRTKTFPQQFFFSLTGSLQYSTTATGNEILSLPGHDRDRFAWGARDRKAPDVPLQIPDRTSAQIAARSGNFSLAEQLDAASRAFDNRGYFPRGKKAGPDLGFSVAVGDRISVGSKEGLFGYTATFSYDREFEHTTGGEQNRFEGIVSAPQARLTLTPDRSNLSFGTAALPTGTPALGVTKSTDRSTWNTFTKLAYRPSADHELSVDLLHTRTADDVVQRGVGEQQRDYPGNLYEVYDLLYTERAVSSLQLTGLSRLASAGDLQVDYRVSYSSSSQEQPDYRTLAMYYDLDGNPVNATGVQPNRFFRDLTEDSLELGLDVARPFTLNGNEGRVKVGGSWMEGDRDYDEQRFQWSNRPQSRAGLEAFPGDIGIVSRGTNEVIFGNTLSRLQEPNRYTADQTITGLYAMAEVPLSATWKVVGGVRRETTKMHTTPVRIPGLNPRDGVIDTEDFLPALSAVYAPTTRTRWRAAYGRTIARPTFKELTDIRYEDVFTLDTYLGNPFVNRSVIDNFDLRWEWFPRRGEVVAASVFFKRMKDPIEVVFTPSTGSIQPQNVDQGKVYGIEFEFRRRLGSFTPALEAFSVGANLALVGSDVTIPETEMASIRLQEPNAKAKRELSGQSPYVFNTDIAYDAPSGRTSASLSYNIVGERLSLVQFGSLPDVYEQPAGSLNFVVTQRVSAHLRLTFSAKNLLDPDFEKRIGFEDYSLVHERYRSGRRFAVACTWLFE